MACLNAVRQFNKGDYLIAFYYENGWGENRTRQVLNSYGAAKKFQVVAVDKHGVPYMKELNKQGKPTGRMICSIKYEKQNRTHIDTALTYRFEVDPDYADSILLDDQANYNASSALKVKSDTFREISEHNKKIKVDCFDAKNLAAFIGTVKVGDLLWRSNVSSWAIVEINSIPRDRGNKIENYSIFMKVTTNRGKVKEICFDDLRRIALYSARPRTYKELQDPK
jgi:hypothetical protein